MTNNKCDLCNGQTGYDYQCDKYTTVTRDHYVINGFIICRPCIEDIKQQIFYKETRKTKKGRNESIKESTPSYTKGQHIKHEAD